MKRQNILFLVALLTLLGPWKENLKEPGRKATKKAPVDYMEMTRILFRHQPGIDYDALHAQYRKENPPLPFSCTDRYTLTSALRPLGLAGPAQGSPSLILVIANSSLYADSRARESVDSYVRDINRGYGCEVKLMTAEGGVPEDIKALIQAQYFLAGLDGVVYVGRLPAAWFEVPNDHYWWNGGYGYADWTCDLFFMDLDGLWEDLDADGKYDSHTAGTGDIEAEIFVGRLDTSSMKSYGAEVDLLCRYLKKDHDYWTGNIKLNRFGLVYTDHDWNEQSTEYFGRLYGSGNYDDLKWQEPPHNEVEKFDYLNNRLPFAFYGFIQVWTHATFEYHQFYSGGICYEREVHSRNPRSTGYNIDGCHACDWAAGEGQYFLGGGYIYNESPSSLAVIGTTKVGGMLEFEPFYRALGENNCLGQAFLDWFNNRLSSRDERGYIIGWHYGMTIVGDPLIVFLEVPGLYRPEEQLKPPLRFSGERIENESLFLKEYIDVLTWQANPASKPGEITGYRVYEMRLNELVPLADINREDFQYWHRNVENRAYHYALSALDGKGQESDFAFTTVK